MAKGNENPVRQVKFPDDFVPPSASLEPGPTTRQSYSVLVDQKERPHVHSLPGYNGEGTGRHHHVRDTVVRCNGCGQVFVWAYSSLDDNGYMDGWGWERLSSWRPKHRRARRLLREAGRG